MSDLTPPRANHYHALARKRGGTAQPSGEASSTAHYRKRSQDRYQSLRTATPETPNETPTEVVPRPEPAKVSHPERGIRRHPRKPRDEQTVDVIPTVSLKDEFQRVKQGQQQTSSRETRFPFGKPQRPIRAAILSLSLVALIIAGAVLGPVAYHAATAYRDVFQEPVEHDVAPFIAAAQPDGTKVIVETTATRQAELPEWDGKDRLTVLLLGVDRREGDEEYSRSDTMILVNFDPVTKSASMLSVPRDLKVIIPGYGVHKINSAYAYGDADQVPGGGPGLVVRTIEANFGITINYYAEVDFEGFVKVMDTVGGLTLDVPYAIKDDEYPGFGNQYMRIYFEPGWQHMDGERILQYARTRHDDGDGRRSARQQQVLIALQEQAISSDLISKAPELITELGSAVRTDIPAGQILSLGKLASEIDPTAVTQFSLDDALYEEQLPDQPYFLVADWDQVGTIMSAFTGLDILPPMSALANPNYAIEIQIEDGTFNPGLGGRVSDVLTGNGFSVVSVTDKPDLGNYPTSSITTNPENLTTAYLVAGLLGIDLSAITVSDEIPPTPTASGSGVQPTATNASQGTPGTGGIALFPTPTGNAAAGTSGNQQPATLVIVLGDDAPDPLYFTVDPGTE